MSVLTATTTSGWWISSFRRLHACIWLVLSAKVRAFFVFVVKFQVDKAAADLKNTNVKLKETLIKVVTVTFPCISIGILLYAGSALRRSEQSNIWWMVWEGLLPTREGHIPGVTFLLMSNEHITELCTCDLSVEQMRSNRNFCVDIILIVIILGIGGYLYTYISTPFPSPFIWPLSFNHAGSNSKWLQDRLRGSH